MKSSTHDKAAGIGKSLGGKIRESTGKVLGNPRLQAKGKAEQIEGKTQRKIGEIEQVAGH